MVLRVYVWVFAEVTHSTVLLICLPVPLWSLQFYTLTVPADLEDCLVVMQTRIACAGTNIYA